MSESIQIRIHQSTKKMLDELKGDEVGYNRIIKSLIYSKDNEHLLNLISAMSRPNITKDEIQRLVDSY